MPAKNDGALFWMRKAIRPPQTALVLFWMESRSFNGGVHLLRAINKPFMVSTTFLRIHSGAYRNVQPMKREIPNYTKSCLAGG
jgi:hypothetical protein